MGLRKVISDFDQQPYPTEVNFSNTTSYRSKTGGFLSLIFLTLVIVIVCFKAIDEFEMNHLSVSTSIAKNDFTVVTADSKAFRFRVQIADNHQFLSKDELMQYGVNITIEKHFLNYTDEFLEEIELIQCPDSMQ